jgi:hypothetical protein
MVELSLEKKPWLPGPDGAGVSREAGTSFLDKRLGDVIDGVASGHRAGDLVNDERGQVDLGVFRAIFHQRPCILLGCHQARVRKEVTVNRVWHVRIENDAGEVSAIVEEQIEVSLVLAVVHGSMKR